MEIFLTSNIFLISRYKTYFVKLLRAAFSKKITVKLCVSLRLSGNIQFCKFLEEKFMVGDTPLFRVIRTTAIPPRQIELKSCFDRKLNYFTRRTWYLSEFIVITTCFTNTTNTILVVSWISTYAKSTTDMRGIPLNYMKYWCSDPGNVQTVKKILTYPSSSSSKDSNCLERRVLYKLKTIGIVVVARLVLSWQRSN